jgi:hypothetical protein
MGGIDGFQELPDKIVVDSTFADGSGQAPDPPTNRRGDRSDPALEVVVPPPVVWSRFLTGLLGRRDQARVAVALGEQVH